MNPRQVVSAGGTSTQSRRREKWAARDVARAVTALDRVRKCGHTLTSDQGVAVKVSVGGDGTRTAGFSGVQSCGSVWACPVCSATIAERRRQEIAQVLTWWHEQAGEIALGTFTVRHRKSQRLRTVWDGVSAGWAAVTSGSSWKAEQAQHGTASARLVKTGRRAGTLALSRVIHTIRVVEVTEGENGWHVHVHVILLLRGGTTGEAASQLGSQMFSRWRDGVTKKGLAAPSERHGVDIRLIKGDPKDTLSDYFTKAIYRASHEVASGMGKRARWENRSPFGVLADVVRDGLADDVDIWGEWERGSKGRRQITWSNGLRRLAGLDGELTDEQIVEEDAGGDVAAWLDPDTWRQVCRQGARLQLLEAFELSDGEGLALLARLKANAA